MTFVRSEVRHQLHWKETTPDLSAAARRAGLYTGPQHRGLGTRRSIFLHEACADENLLPAIREEALDLFRTIGISWHDGPDDGRPSNYLLDSMVSCVNCLLPFARDGAALAALLRSIVSDAVDALVIEDGRVLTFEWLGEGNLLRESSPFRRRGSHGTSADAFCVLKGQNGATTGVLIEWKYTESYQSARFHFGAPYRPFLEAPDGPIDVSRCGGSEPLFVDPLYQFARFQLLAHQLERTGVADRVILLVIAPDGNVDFRKHVPAVLRASHPGLDLAESWKALLRQPDRFALTSFRSLMASCEARTLAIEQAEARYVRTT